MKFKNNIFLLLLALAGSAQAISFHDYYHGNEALGIPAHEKEVNAAVASGTLVLNNKNLSDLTGFGEIPGLSALTWLALENNELSSLPENVFHGVTALAELWLRNNQLTSLRENIFHGLKELQSIALANNQLTTLPRNILNGLNELRCLTIYNNPIPFDQAQMRKIIKLPANVDFYFKTREQELVEHELFAAIKEANDAGVRKQFEFFRPRRGMAPMGDDIVVSKIRNANGENLLQAAIREAAERLRVVEGMSVGIPEAEKKEVKAVQAEQKNEINDRYMKVISAILSCGEDCVQDMLFTPNAQGQGVIDVIFAKLGPDSPILKAIFEGLRPEEEKKVGEEQHEVQK